MGTNMVAIDNRNKLHSSLPLPLSTRTQPNVAKELGPYPFQGKLRQPQSERSGHVSVEVFSRLVYVKAA
jgi:hypothetical protein